MGDGDTGLPGPYEILIAALKAENERLRAALEPYSGFGEFMELETEGFADADKLRLVLEESDFILGEVTVGDFRRARAALQESTE